jgi:hypothetical protein
LKFGLESKAVETADFDERRSAMFALAPATDTAQRGLDVG